MKPAASGLAVLAAGLAGCAAFGSPGPATFGEPAAQLARPLGKAAARPALRLATSAESLADIRVLGDRALLDLRGESGDDSSFDAHATCGPLELRAVPSGAPVWSVARDPECHDQILATSPSVTVIGQRTVAARRGLYLTAYALATGAVRASVALDDGAWAIPAGDDVVLVRGAAGKQTLSLRDAELTARWTTAIADRGALARVIVRPKTLLVFGQSVTVVDRARGAATAATPLGEGAKLVDALVTAEGTYATIARAGALAVARVTDEGRVVWTQPTTGAVDAASPGQVITVAGADVTARRVSDGSVAWTAVLPAPTTGAGVIARGRWFVPHAKGVSVLDAATGALVRSAQPLPASAADVHADRMVVADDLVLLDAARGLAALDRDGAVRYALAVRSLPYASREGRLRAAGALYDLAALRAQNASAAAISQANATALNNLSTTMGGGLMLGSLQMQQAGAAYGAARAAGNYADLQASLNARKQQQAAIALAQARIDDDSPYIVRPLSWASGRGVLVLRKRDGAFRELVTGPPDVYEDRFRPASVAALAAGTVLTFSEGLDPAQWTIGPVRQPTQLIARRLLGYRVADADLTPAGDYAQRSVVPAGAFEGP